MKTKNNCKNVKDNIFVSNKFKLLKFLNEKTSPKKLINTKKNCKKDIERILVLIFLSLLLKFIIDTGIIRSPKIKLNIKE